MLFCCKNMARITNDNNYLNAYGMRLRSELTILQQVLVALKSPQNFHTSFALIIPNLFALRKAIGHKARSGNDEL